MLLEFGLRNFFCFKEGVSISFKLDKNCPSEVARGRNFTTAMCVKGANGSGKTHLLKGLSFLGWFCASSFEQKPDAPTGVAPFFQSKKPTELYAEFAIGESTFLYELSVTEREIRRETIYRTVGKRTKIVERKGDEIVFCTNEFDRLKTMNLRRNASIISSAHQYGFSEIGELYAFFSGILTNVTYAGLSEPLTDIDAVSAHLNSDGEFLGFVKSYIENCDGGVSDLKIVSSKKEDGTDQYSPLFIHEVEGKKYSVTRHAESSGTKMLFRRLPLYKIVLDTGGILVLDEFEMHLHPHLLPSLVRLFEDPESNPKDAQLLFTTHDSEIMNYMGRYRTYLVNKEDNISFAYRLDEIPGDLLRNGRPLVPAYNDGKIGGVPRI